MSRARWTWALVLAPLAVSVVVAIVVLVSDPPVRLVLSIHPAGLVLLLGMVATTAAAVLPAIARARRTAAEAARRQALEDARADHRRFLDRLDHELKNPVTAIRAALAAHGDTGSPHLSAADAQAARLAALVGELRKLAELRTCPLKLEAVDLGELTADALDAVRGSANGPAAPGQTMTMTFPTAPWTIPSILADPDLLYLAVHNVLANAVKFTTAGDHIEVRGSEDDGWVQLEVADTGRGIPRTSRR